MSIKTPQIIEMLLKAPENQLDTDAKEKIAEIKTSEDVKKILDDVVYYSKCSDFTLQLIEILHETMIKEEVENKK